MSKIYRFLINLYFLILEIPSPSLFFNCSFTDHHHYPSSLLKFSQEKSRIIIEIKEQIRKYLNFPIFLRFVYRSVIIVGILRFIMVQYIINFGHFRNYLYIYLISNVEDVSLLRVE